MAPRWRGIRSPSARLRPGVVRKKDSVMTKVRQDIAAPSAESKPLNAPTMSTMAVASFGDPNHVARSLHAERGEANSL